MKTETETHHCLKDLVDNGRLENAIDVLPRSMMELTVFSKP